MPVDRLIEGERYIWTSTYVYSVESEPLTLAFVANHSTHPFNAFNCGTGEVFEVIAGTDRGHTYMGREYSFEVEQCELYAEKSSIYDTLMAVT